MKDKQLNGFEPGSVFYKGAVKHAISEPFKSIVEFVRMQPSILTGLPPGRSFGKLAAMEALNIEEQIVIWRKHDAWRVEVGLFSNDTSAFDGDVTDEALQAFSASTSSSN